MLVKNRSLESRPSRPWTFSVTCVALLLVALAASLTLSPQHAAGSGNDANTGPGRADQEPAKKPAAESPYDYFLYVRHNEEKGMAVTDSLVLAKVSANGFQQRDVFTESNLDIGWHPLAVINGRAYGVRFGDLIAIDLKSGTSEKLGSHVNPFVYDSGRLYSFAEIPEKGQSTVLRVCDFRSRSYRDIELGAIVNHSAVERLAVFTRWAATRLLQPPGQGPFVPGFPSQRRRSYQRGRQGVSRKGIHAIHYERNYWSRPWPDVSLAGQ